MNSFKSYIEKPCNNINDSREGTEKCMYDTGIIQTHADFVLSFFTNSFNVCYKKI